MCAECLVADADCPAPLLVGSQEHWLASVGALETVSSLVGRKVLMTRQHLETTKGISPDPPVP